MQTIIDDLVKQATHTAMNVNGKKTKEMLVGTVSRDPPPPLMLGGATVDRVTTFKLLGVHVSDDLRWQQHVDAISSKAASRLWFLRQLKRSGAPIEDLLCFYKTVVRPVLEYACPVWHSSLTKGKTNALERFRNERCASSSATATTRQPPSSPTSTRCKPAAKPCQPNSSSVTSWTIHHA